MADTMKGLKRTHYCGTVTPEMIGREVVVCGWAQKTRDMGTLVFIDLRDRTGIVQLAFDDKTDPALLAKAQKVRAEYVLMARGVLRQRESVNHEIPTGEVEVYVTELRVLAESNTPPFAISDDSRGVKEDLRLKYRYLDLRRPEMQNAIAMRHPRLLRYQLLLRDRDPHPHQVHPGGRPRLPGTQPCAAGQVLRSAPVPPAV